METIIKTQSYTDKLPNINCSIKVAVKIKNWNFNQSIKTEVFENGIYEDGFVSIDGGETFYLAGKFIFHKMKRNKLC